MLALVVAALTFGSTDLGVIAAGGASRGFDLLTPAYVVAAAAFAIVVVAETKVLPMSVMRQILLRRVTETHNDSPEQAVRPFDADADGTAVGEGGGLFILEEYDHAQKRGAKIYAELVGFGASQDTFSVTLTI